MAWSAVFIKWLRSQSVAHVAFCGMFAFLTLQTLAMHSGGRLGPGQDVHYHLFSASVVARDASDPLGSLYSCAFPWAPNALIYAIAWPMNRFGAAPPNALNFAMLATSYIGFPLACAYALKRTKRSLWGALLAFPIIYCKSWSQGGYLPFVSGASFFIATIGEFAALHEARGSAERQSLFRCVILSLLAFLAHGHVYTWMTACMGMLTTVLALRALCVLPQRGIGAAIVGMVRVCGVSLAAIGPSLIFYSRWQFENYRASKVAGVMPVPVVVDADYQTNIVNLWAEFVHTKHVDEFEYVAALGAVCLAAILLVRRVDARFPAFELAALLTLASFFVLPASVNAQTIGSRQLDIATWFIPVLLVPQFATASKLRAVAVAVVMFTYSTARLHIFDMQLDLLNRISFDGLKQLGATCKKLAAQPGPHRMAYVVNEGIQPPSWHSPSYHQAHLTVAAYCGIDAPAYDTSVYPYKLLPVAYRGRMGAPVTLLENAQNWPDHPRLWEHFDFVLVRKWSPSPEALRQLEEKATLVAQENDFALWQRKASIQNVAP